MQHPCWHCLQAGSSFLFLVLTIAPSLSSLNFLIGPVIVSLADDDGDQNFYTVCGNKCVWRPISHFLVPFLWKLNPAHSPASSFQGVDDGTRAFLRWILGSLTRKLAFLCQNQQDLPEVHIQYSAALKHSGGGLLAASSRPRRLSF